MKWLIFSSLLVIGAVWCQDDLELPKDLIKDIPNLDVGEVETEAAKKYAEDALAILKSKCANNTGGNEVYSELETKANALQTFITDNINFTVVMSELEEAKKTGSMDEVFAKYCARKPEAMERLKNITEAFKKCLLPEEQKSIDVKLRLTENMVNFLCEKDGDKIAMFIANGGEECLSSKVDGLQQCFNASSANLPTTNWQSVNLVEVDEIVCKEFPVLEVCVVDVLEECKGKTPANIVGAMFKFLRKHMECAPQKEAVSAPDQRKPAFVDDNRIKRNVPNTANNRFLTKCAKNNPNNRDAYHHLNTSARSFASAFFDNVFLKDLECLALKNDTQYFRESFLYSLNQCVSLKENFVLDFIRRSVDGVFDYLCANNAKKLNEYRHAGGLQCIVDIDKQEFFKCATPTLYHTTDGGEVVMEVEQFCKDVTTIRKCVKNSLLPRCSYDRTFKDITEDLLKLVDEKCTGCSIFVNSFLLCLLAFYHIYKYL